MSRKEIVQASAQLLVERLLEIAFNRKELTLDVDPESLRISDAELEALRSDAIGKDVPRRTTATAVECGSTPVTIRIHNRVLKAFKAESE